MKYASIQRIENIILHPNADFLALATIMGWQVVVKKDTFKVGDLVIYIETDSVVPAIPQFSFLENKNYRVKAIKLRGEWSEGLIVPLSEFPDLINYNEGDDISEIIGVKHYEKPIHTSLRGEIAGGLPYGISKTDEERIQSCLRCLDEINGLDCYISVKIDGSSSSYVFKDGDFQVCSRSLSLKRSEQNAFWRLNYKYDIESKLRKLNKNIVLRGELCGEKIQGNKMGLSELSYFLYDVYDLDKREYIDFRGLSEYYSYLLDIPICPTIYIGKFNFTLKELEEMAENVKYPNGAGGEGIVVRPIIPVYSNKLRKRLSFKVISKKYASRE